MAQQPETGDIRAGAGAVVEQTLRRLTVRLDHGLQRPLDPPPLGFLLHVGGEQGAGAERLGEDQYVADRHAALTENGLAVGQAVDREPQRQLRPFAGMAANQGRAGLVEDIYGTGHHFADGRFDLGFQAVGNGRDGESRLGLRPHGEDVAQGVVRGNLPEHVSVVDKGPEVVHRMDHHLAVRNLNDGRVVGGM